MIIFEKFVVLGLEKVRLEKMVGPECFVVGENYPTKEKDDFSQLLIERVQLFKLSFWFIR
ncbi:MAG: hypothetical protein F6K48_14290 [Okeania sp. SIO3H1]|uniref:hypothetical protein n=1 Tax=Okeania sp. SIO1I7 TaxID=2607772 RepID=UPI0013C7CC51|nr:hypothetical protein [Okeania sp. SIO1I7]NEN90015.1 hypothetical protein [Okeania sp. SIO3H1]NET24970.1 hypothetical protein [Okeania sp. SIO1I7]